MRFKVDASSRVDRRRFHGKTVQHGVQWRTHYSLRLTSVNRPPGAFEDFVLSDFSWQEIKARIPVRENCWMSAMRIVEETSRKIQLIFQLLSPKTLFNVFRDEIIKQ